MIQMLTIMLRMKDLILNLRNYQDFRGNKTDFKDTIFKNTVSRIPSF